LAFFTQQAVPLSSERSKQGKGSQVSNSSIQQWAEPSIHQEAPSLESEVSGHGVTFNAGRLTEFLEKWKTVSSD
jgi:hypothetical protein